MTASKSVDFSHKLINHVRGYYETDEFVPLHAPSFTDIETRYVLDAIQSTFVSTVGQYVNRIEDQLCSLTGATHAVATVNGTAALQVALRLVGVQQGSEVITQPLTFVATGNAIRYLDAQPIFLDVDRHTLGLSTSSVRKFLEEQTKQEGGFCVNKSTGRRIAACVPMHTFGFSTEIDGLVDVCDEHNVPIVEDAAEALGSSSKDQALGTFGKVGVLSFNGNKVVTAGGGGAILTSDPELAAKAKHVTTTAKVPHKWEYVHDEVGYNFRMPNLNAALLAGQLERLPELLQEKRSLADSYRQLCKEEGVQFYSERTGTRANYWLMTVALSDEQSRNEFLQATNDKGVMTRPAWHLLSGLEMFKSCQAGDLSTAADLASRLVNIPSSPRP